ncbi:MAG: hypothetical protein ABL874_12510 [Sphingopyxis sp.]
MKTFKRICAQGDIYIERLPDDFELPAAATETKSENGRIIVTHSETGHHHVMDVAPAKNRTRPRVQMYTLPDSIMDFLLIVNDPVALEHLREYDTHEPIMFEKGKYRVRRQREYTPEGFRRVED